MFKQFTLGIEEEFQIVDPHTRELRSHVSEILEEGKMLLGEQVKPEMIQSDDRSGRRNLQRHKRSSIRYHKTSAVSFLVWCTNEENKWRVVRYGLDGKMIDFGKSREVPVRDLFVNFWSSSTMCLTILARAKKLAHLHNSRARHLSRRAASSLAKDGRPHAVVDHLIEATMENVPCRGFPSP
jgi:gamma-glutamyl:cysteine ligase YbdK (ATP-grasp superfamily)